MKSAILSFMLGAVIFLGLFTLLVYAARNSDVAHKERSIQKECIDKNGLMIPRTYVCVKNESVIKLENLK